MKLIKKSLHTWLRDILIMNNFNKSMLYKAFAFAFFMLVCNVFTFAQPGPILCPDGSEDDGSGDCLFADVPIDGGASVLIAAGVAYGLKKAYEKRKQNKATDVV